MLGLFPELFKVIFQSNLFHLGICQDTESFMDELQLPTVCISHGAIPVLPHFWDNQSPEVPWDEEQVFLCFLWTGGDFSVFQVVTSPVEIHSNLSPWHLQA